MQVYKVIIYNFHGYGRELLLNVDIIKSITKTGIINLEKSSIRFKDTISLGDVWYKWYMIKFNETFLDAYKAGTKLLNAEKVIQENLHLLPQAEIITLAENLLFLKNTMAKEDKSGN